MTRKHLSNLHVSLLAYWACLGGALYLFAELAGEVSEHEGFFFDAPILSWFAAHQTFKLVSTAQALSLLFAPVMLALVSAGIAIALGKKHLRDSLFLALSLGGATLLNVFFKLFFERLRPSVAERLTPAPGFLFPSGHAMASAAFSLGLYLLIRRLYPRYQWGIAFVGVLLTFLVGLSRLDLQVHYPSDVLAGWALAVAWVLGVNLWYARTNC